MESKNLPAFPQPSGLQDDYFTSPQAFDISSPSTPDDFASYFTGKMKVTKNFQQPPHPLPGSGTVDSLPGPPPSQPTDPVPSHLSRPCSCSFPLSFLTRSFAPLYQQAVMAHIKKPSLDPGPHLISWFSHAARSSTYLPSSQSPLKWLQPGAVLPLF